MRFLPRAVFLALTASSFPPSSFGFLVPQRASSVVFAVSTGSNNSCAAPPHRASSSSTMEKPTAENAYETLVKKLSTITQLERAKSVLGYDQLVFMSQDPSTSKERGAQLAALAEIIHEKTTAPELHGLMQQAAGCFDSGSDEARLLELETKKYLENQRVPTELAAKAASLSSSAYSAWVEARTNNDFDAFAPVLKDCFDTAMAIADAKRGDNKDIDLYTQMLDEFEMGMSQQRIDDIFGEIQSALVPLISKVLDSSTKPSTDALAGTFSIDGQKRISETIVKAMGFSVEQGRIDVSVHPFTTSFSPHDVRITSRFKETEWYQGLAGSIHEGGHAIYEQSLGDSALSLDTALSMGTHESQSLFWERHIGLSKAFWKWATPLLQKEFDWDYSPEQVYGAVNAVSSSLIRVEADELTYPLHVILRYNIEREIVQGKLDVKDIPERWNKDMKSLLDIDVPNDAQGCLQDVHWSALAIGYFPTYLIGSATAAQLAHYCKKDIPDMEELIEKGEFASIKAWLTDKIHRHGRRYPSLDALLEAQIGEKLNPKYFIDYLTNKYSALYAL